LRNSEFEIRNEWIGERRLRLLVAIIVWLAAALGMEALAQDQPVADQKSGVETAARKKQREENLKAMEERARATKIRLTGDAKGRADLITQPLFHYTDEPRRITDATLWGWTFEGRLLAVCKIEKYDIDDPAKKWLYCFGSLASELIEGEWEWGHTWSAKKPGIELVRISSAPSPAAGKGARLRQMKEIAGRFAATIIDPKAGTREEMRLLP